MIYSSASWLTDGSPWISMFTAGYVFQSYDHMTKVLNGDITIDNNSEMADPSTAGLSNVNVNYIGG